VKRGLDERFKPHVREKDSLGVKNVFLGNTKKKKYRAGNKTRPLVTKHDRHHDTAF
jgi:hypothetical protein